MKYFIPYMQGKKDMAMVEAAKRMKESLSRHRVAEGAVPIFIVK
jgi:hypothetical protein